MELALNNLSISEGLSSQNVVMSKDELCPEDFAKSYPRKKPLQEICEDTGINWKPIDNIHTLITKIFKLPTAKDKLKLNKQKKKKDIVSSFDGSNLNDIKIEIMNNVNGIINGGIKYTEPGSLKYLLFGSQPSEQSVSIKMGKVGEELFKLIIIVSPNIELIDCGIQYMETAKKKKDIDLAWICMITKTIYIRELKANIELDTEKLPATFEKIKNTIVPHMIEKYPGYKVDYGILNWSIYSRGDITRTLTHIKTCEDHGVKVDHVKDFLETVNFDWNNDDYIKFFRSIGIKFKSMFETEHKKEIEDLKAEIDRLNKVIAAKR